MKASSQYCATVLVDSPLDGVLVAHEVDVLILVWLRERETVALARLTRSTVTVTSGPTSGTK